MTEIDIFSEVNDGFKAVELLLFRSIQHFLVASSDFVSRVAYVVSQLLIRVRSLKTEQNDCNVYI